MDRQQGKSVWRIVVPDITTVIILGLIEFYLNNFVKPHKRGFFCDDETIRYPAHESTVPSAVLNIVGVGAAIITILAVEAKKGKKNMTLFNIGKFKVRQLHWNIYQLVVGYSFGALCNQIITEVGKKAIGRLRPHFWATCNPNISETCHNVPQYLYIINYECTNTADSYSLTDIRVSFPSGHSSFSFYCAVFIIAYLQLRCQCNGKHSALIRPLVQFAVLIAAWFTSLSRVMDNKHHWSDVLAGITIGTIVALVTVIFVMKSFRSLDQKKTETEEETAGNANNDSHVQL